MHWLAEGSEKLPLGHKEHTASPALENVPAGQLDAVVPPPKEPAGAPPKVPPLVTQVAPKSLLW